MKKVIFATGNEGKMKEIREILGDLDIQLLSLKDAGITADIEENGSSFEENAVIKATWLSVTLPERSLMRLRSGNRLPE